MRLSLFLFMLCSISCLGQQTKEQPSKTGSLKLIDPKPEPQSAEDTLMFKNSIVLFRPNYTVIYNSTENTFTNLNNLSSHLQKTSALLKRRKFYILIDNNTKPDKIISVLDLLQKYQIENYKLVNYQEDFKPRSSDEYQIPTVTLAVSKPHDSSYFSIKIIKDSLELSILDKKQIADSPVEIDRFISINKMQIDPDKIIIVADAKTPYERFKPVVDVLKKHEYYRFKVVTQ